MRTPDRYSVLVIILAMVPAWHATAIQDQPQQEAAPKKEQAEEPLAIPAPEGMPQQIHEAIQEGIQVILSMQEGPDNAEWPYEGVYRVRGRIPIGYRVGGTGICGEAILRAPGYEQDPARQEAIARATGFVTGAIELNLMDPEYRGGYDVRGWGYCYGLRFLLAMQMLDRVPPGQEQAVAKAIAFYIDAMEKTDIPEVGGWSYSRRRGLDTPSPTSPFMTAPCLQTLYLAQQQGHPVDQDVIKMAIKALQDSCNRQGNVMYSAMDKAPAGADSIPGAVGRMVALESALNLAGKSSPMRLNRAVEAFIEHWNELEKRRQKNGTHEPPYGVAPYYFFYAHFHAAQAAQMLPEQKRLEAHKRINELLFSVREKNGSWNDRVFKRSANYGTAMSIMALLQPYQASPPGAVDAVKAPADGADA